MARISDYSTNLIIKKSEITFKVHLEIAFLDAFKDITITLTGLLQRFFGRFVLGDIFYEGQPVLQIAVIILNGSGPHDSPQVIAILLQVTLFGLIRIVVVVKGFFAQADGLCVVIRVGDVHKC